MGRRGRRAPVERTVAASAGRMPHLLLAGPAGFRRNGLAPTTCAFLLRDDIHLQSATSTCAERSTPAGSGSQRGLRGTGSCAKGSRLGLPAGWRRRLLPTLAHRLHRLASLDSLSPPGATPRHAPVARDVTRRIPEPPLLCADAHAAPTAPGPRHAGVQRASPARTHIELPACRPRRPWLLLGRRQVPASAPAVQVLAGPALVPPCGLCGSWTGWSMATAAHHPTLRRTTRDQPPGAACAATGVASAASSVCSTSRRRLR